VYRRVVTVSREEESRAGGANGAHLLLVKSPSTEVRSTLPKLPVVRLVERSSGRDHVSLLHYWLRKASLLSATNGESPP
jgi:hypothetical protein